MKAQLLRPSRPDFPGSHRLAPGQALHLGRGAGELNVIDGRVWLTRDRDLGDHVVEAGQRVRLAIDDNAVVEPLHAGQSVVLRWVPRGRCLVGALLAAPLDGLARLAGEAADGFAALARHAASNAGRLQGRLDADGTGLPSR